MKSKGASAGFVEADKDNVGDVLLQYGKVCGHRFGDGTHMSFGEKIDAALDCAKAQ